MAQVKWSTTEHVHTVNQSIVFIVLGTNRRLIENQSIQKCMGMQLDLSLVMLSHSWLAHVGQVVRTCQQSAGSLQRDPL